MRTPRDFQPLSPSKPGLVFSRQIGFLQAKPNPTQPGLPFRLASGCYNEDMQVALAFAASINGKITKGDDPNVIKWTSNEDKAFYKRFLKKQDVLIRTSATYKLSHHDGSGAHYKQIVLTRSPEKYRHEAIKNRLEFTNETPKKLIERLEQEGNNNVLLAVGRNVASLFLKEDLIDEFYLTIEPLLFGKGAPMFSEEKFDKKATLKSMKKVNNNGTLLLHYRIDRTGGSG